LAVKAKTQRAIHALNAMEAVAIPFVIGAADSSLAVASIGVTYLESLEGFGYVVACVLEAKPDALPCARALYAQWHAQLF
jgi:hypothetical protein